MSKLQRESTLTTPSDRNLEKKFQFDDVKPLSTKELTKAMKELNTNSFVKNFPQVERRYTDPPIVQQKIGLFSFIPAKGATPNNEGIYGFAKLRGNFDTEKDADAQRVFRKWANQEGAALVVGVQLAADPANFVPQVDMEEAGWDELYAHTLLRRVDVVHALGTQFETHYRLLVDGREAFTVETIVIDGK